MTPPDIRKDVAAYYSEKLSRFGPSPRGVDWNSDDSQQLRFRQLLQVVSTEGLVSLNDLGCGYGALHEFLSQQRLQYRYTGYDLSDAMIDEARRRNQSRGEAEFRVGETLDPADYTVASGIFNVKLETSVADWEDYILETLSRMNAASGRGFSFNMLTSYSDADRMRPDLYYGEPGRYFDHCMRHFSRHIALLHDYGLYEFTILVRKG